MNIAYIVSLKQPGLIAWVYREMVALEKIGAKISVFPTKYSVGPYMPKKNWFTARWNLFDIFIAQIRWLVHHPVVYLSSLIVALRFFAIREFGLATYFALIIKRLGVERIHCHLGDRKLYTGYFCKLLLRDTRLSVTIHAHELYINPNWKLFPVALNACDHIICIADLNRKILTDKWRIRDNKISVIRLFGFDKIQKTDPSVILCVGRFEYKKGHDILLNSISELVDEGLDIELWLAGNPEPGAAGVDIMGYAKKMDIDKRVVMFGEVGEKVLKVLYRKCDIFCLLSRHDKNGVPEGIPVVLMEAMSMGKPVIATNTGAVHELVEEILVDEENVKAAKDAIRKILGDIELQKRMGRRNIEIVKNSYSVSNAMKLYNALSTR